MIHFLPSKESLELLQNISEQISDMTFHHHYHVLYDVPLPNNPIYLEIGCYAGGSACLMLQKENITVISVDLGYPIDESVVRKNVSKLNHKNNKFYYVKNNSQLESTVELVKQISPEIDLLFIDGDHTFDGVIKDFHLWSPLVKSGGYIIFDDYNDKKYSPEVKIAVDEIIKNMQRYDVIGTFANTLGARPINDIPEGNCFVVRKQ